MPLSIVMRAFPLVLILALVACAPGTGGTGNGTTMHMTITSQGGAGIFGGEIMSAARTGTDKLVGDLVEQADGTWRGTVNASTTYDIETIVMGTDCKTTFAGTQRIDVVGTSGTYPDGRDFKLTLTSAGAPQITARDTCQPGAAETTENGLLYFVFVDFQEGEVFVGLPDRPGGTWTGTVEETMDINWCQGLNPLASCGQLTTVTVTYDEP